MTNEDIARRLDTIIAILQLANREEIESARSAIRADKVNAAILDATTKEIPAGKLMTTVKTKTKQSPATISRRITALLEQGALEKSGGGRTTAYRATGLV
jgi:DNA-binding transcriptional ArsR family regulator